MVIRITRIFKHYEGVENNIDLNVRIFNLLLCTVDNKNVYALLHISIILKLAKIEVLKNRVI